MNSQATEKKDTQRNQYKINIVQWKEIFLNFYSLKFLLCFKPLIDLPSYSHGMNRDNVFLQCPLWVMQMQFNAFVYHFKQYHSKKIRLELEFKHSWYKFHIHDTLCVFSCWALPVGGLDSPILGKNNDFPVALHSSIALHSSPINAFMPFKNYAPPPHPPPISPTLVWSINPGTCEVHLKTEKMERCE